jgi:hypothetical protein
MALPVFITHGWPGSVFEILKVVGTADGKPDRAWAEVSEDASIGRYSLACRVYGFSGKPARHRLGSPTAIARNLAELMKVASA